MQLTINSYLWDLSSSAHDLDFWILRKTKWQANLDTWSSISAIIFTANSRIRPFFFILDKSIQFCSFVEPRTNADMRDLFYLFQQPSQSKNQWINPSRKFFYDEFQFNFQDQNCRRLKHKISIRDIKKRKRENGKVYNTIEHKSFYLYILQKIIQISENTRFYIDKVSTKNYKLAISIALVILMLNDDAKCV